MPDSLVHPHIEAIFITPCAGFPMIRVPEVRAIAGRGLEGDRYAQNAGYYSRLGGGCELTLIEGEVLDAITTDRGLQVRHGEHRRNLVTRGLVLRELHGTRLCIGDVLLEYDRPRPPCGHVERLTEKGMTRALGLGAGVAVRILASGLLRAGAEIELLPGGVPRRRLP
jgi:MOSC domain-containing protein YiiM